MERKVANDFAELRRRRSVLPRDVVHYFKAAVFSFLRQVGRMPQMRRTRHEDRGECLRLIAENRSRLLEVTKRKPKLMNQRRRKHMRVVHAQRLRLQLVVHTKGRKI